MPGDSDNGHAAKGLFLVGRFRSGSTAIWNVLRNIPGITAYYEPCHDSLLEHLEAQTATDPTHIGITDYWQEYAAIRAPLERCFSRRFAVERLCLAEHDEHPELEAYLRFLLSSGGKDKRAALKLNRVDFRLPWLRARFPDVPVLYVYRNPRDQWVSIIRNQPSSDVDTPGLNSGYDLITWCANLYPYLPRIGSSAISSSYERVYLLSRLSEEIAKVYADCRIDFDSEIQGAPEIGLGKLVSMLGVDPEQIQKLRPLLVERQGGRWRDYHDEAWFSETESRCDDYLLESGILDEVRAGSVFSKPAPTSRPATAIGVIYPLVGEVSRCRSTLLQTVSRQKMDLAHAHSYSAQLETELEKLKQDTKTGFEERDRKLREKDQEYRKLSEYLDKLAADAELENRQRDRIITRQKQYIRSLQKELGKLRVDADREIEQRQKTIDKQSAFALSLEKELGKLRVDADREIEQRQKTIDKQSAFALSLEKELEKVRAEAGAEIAGRDDIVSKQQQYLASLETELDKLRREAGEQIAARDAAIAENTRYIGSLESEMKRYKHDATSEISARDEMIRAKDRYIEALLAEADTLQKSLK